MVLTKADMAKDVMIKNGFSKKQSIETVKILIELIKASLEESDEVLISGFGKFCVKQKSERRGRNPQTGDDLMMAPRKVVRFRCPGKLQEKING
jgi:integration host factor subunit alpha